MPPAPRWKGTRNRDERRRKPPVEAASELNDGLGTCRHSIKDDIRYTGACRK